MRAKTLTRFAMGVLAVATIGCASSPPRRVIYVRRAPPAEIVEVIPSQPGPAYVWVRGHFRWDGDDYHWVPGHWQVVPSGYREWVPGHWAEREGQWFWVEGHWR